MREPRFKIVIFGLSISSSWGNGHATTYRALVRGLVERNHEVLFFEHDKPWYASNRDLPSPPYGRLVLYSSLAELRERYAKHVREADVAIVGSFVPEGAALGEWVLRTARGIRAFYDIDTPITLAALAQNSCEYLKVSQIPRYDLYLSFTGGPTLARLQNAFGSPAARALYCSVDPQAYRPEPRACKWDLGYLGTYCKDRQKAVQEFIIDTASSCAKARFVVAGSLYPESVVWPSNVERIEHIPPQAHRSFYNSQKFTLNITRADMLRAGHSPSVRLFEAAACAVPIISDYWLGLGELLEIGKEVLVARRPDDILSFLQTIDEERRQQIGNRARAKIIRYHSYQIRARQLETYVLEEMDRCARANSRSTVGNLAGAALNL